MSQDEETEKNDDPVSIVEKSSEISFSQIGHLNDFLDSVEHTEEKKNKFSAQNHIVLSGGVSYQWVFQTSFNE